MNKTKNAKASLIQHTSSPFRAVGPRVIAGAILAFLSLPAQALELGHSRVTSAPGEPLQVVIPVVDVSQADAASLSVSIADAASWQAAGLTPPVPLNTLSISVQDGRKPSERLVRVSSPRASESTIIDVLLDVSTQAASRALQTSIIVPPPPTVRLAGQEIIVQRGDTLIGLAEQFPVEGANLYQQLWALYSSNADAFIRENMNLLKTGASLRIPDADAVRAVDPAFAKAQYLAHVRAFRQGSGAGQGNRGIAADAQAQTLQSEPQQTQRGEVQAPQAQPAAPVENQVRLTAAEQADEVAQSDIATSEQKQRAEELERQQSLEQNVQALQGAINELQDGSSDQTDMSSTEKAAQDGAETEAAGAAQDASASDQPSTDAATSATSADGQADGRASDPAAQNNPQTTDTAQSNAQDHQAQSQNAFERASQWVSDNTTAAIALLLALIALVLAWALRAGKRTPDPASVLESRVDPVSSNFQDKLKEIDLSLEDQPADTVEKSDKKP